MHEICHMLIDLNSKQDGAANCTLNILTKFELTTFKENWFTSFTNYFATLQIFKFDCLLQLYKLSVVI